MHWTSRLSAAGLVLIQLQILLHVAAAANVKDITFVDASWKEYVSKDHDPAWTKGKDALADAGFQMRAFRGGKLNEPVREPLHSHFGNVTIQLYPPLIKQDFYQQYMQPTFWPYCESLEECVVYSQNVSAVESVPLVIALPTGVGAIDFYIDLAIDCVNTTNVTMPCQVTVAAAPVPLIVKRNVSSICSSAKVGQYFGFYNRKGGSIDQLTVTCKGAYSRVLGLLRLGRQSGKEAAGMERMDLSSSGHAST